jgi:dienelactone hydrolase
MPNLKPITYEHAGTTLLGLIAIPEGPGPHPAVLVMHDARGLGDLVKQRATTLASLGYVALATDMYGGGVNHTNGIDAAPLMMAFHQDPQKLRDRVVGWLEVLKAQPGVDSDRTAAIGFCFGGQCVLELARSGADVKVVVSYHGLLTTQLPTQQGVIKALATVFTGTEDPYAPAEHVEGFRQEMKAAGAKWQVTEFSGVYHAFTDPNGEREMTQIPGLKYDALADRLSWTATLELLANMRDKARAA